MLSSLLDIYRKKADSLADELSATFIEPDQIYSLDVHIFSPCALGGVIIDDTLLLLNCYVIAGATNNILDDETEHASRLDEFGIIYAPDYVINAGGIINISSELEGYNEELAMRKTSRIYDTMTDILTMPTGTPLPRLKHRTGWPKSESMT